jgi:hypothetical protein
MNGLRLVQTNWQPEVCIRTRLGLQVRGVDLLFRITNNTSDISIKLCTLQAHLKHHHGTVAVSRHCRLH